MSIQIIPVDHLPTLQTQLEVYYQIYLRYGHLHPAFRLELEHQIKQLEQKILIHPNFVILY